MAAAPRRWKARFALTALCSWISWAAVPPAWSVRPRASRVPVSTAAAGSASSRGCVPWATASILPPWDPRRPGPRYLELLPRRPSELLAHFSRTGRLNHLGARLLRMPPFAIAATSLGIHEADLRRAIARHLPPTA